MAELVRCEPCQSRALRFVAWLGYTRTPIYFILSNAHGAVMLHMNASRPLRLCVLAFCGRVLHGPRGSS